MSFRYPDDHKYTRPSGLNAGVEKKLLQNDIAEPAPPLALAPETSIDFRKARREGFILWYAAQVLTDIDPAFPTLDEIFDRYELSLKQQYWVAFLYATFYENATVFLVMQDFPELEKVDLGRLQRWQKNWKLLQYQTDRRWNKGHFVEMVRSYTTLIGNQTQHQFFSNLMVPDDPAASFNNCWNELHKVHKMGRHSVYAWTETLMPSLGLPIRCPSFYMNIAESSRNGLCYAVDRNDLVTKHDKKLSNGAHISKAEIDYLEGELDRLMAVRNALYLRFCLSRWRGSAGSCSSSYAETISGISARPGRDTGGATGFSGSRSVAAWRKAARRAYSAILCARDLCHRTD
jgi:hypothetical protein